MQLIFSLASAVANAAVKPGASSDEWMVKVIQAAI
ncbi:hypothetical protein FHW88_000723 [Mucilaginibacter sp. SG538B]|nr:hypothetical protein [Mucilaginibacter sp. SG538B]